MFASVELSFAFPNLFEGWLGRERMNTPGTRERQEGSRGWNRDGIDPFQGGDKKSRRIRPGNLACRMFLNVVDLNRCGQFSFVAVSFHTRKSPYNNMPRPLKKVKNNCVPLSEPGC